MIDIGRQRPVYMSSSSRYELSLPEEMDQPEEAVCPAAGEHCVRLTRLAS